MARASWTPAIETTLIESLIRQTRLGKKSENGFKKEVWTAAIFDIHEEHGKSFERQQLKTKFNSV